MSRRKICLLASQCCVPPARHTLEFSSNVSCARTVELSAMGNQGWEIKKERQPTGNVAWVYLYNHVYMSIIIFCFGAKRRRRLGSVNIANCLDPKIVFVSFVATNDF